MVDKYRTFIAIELPDDVRARIGEHVNRLRRELPEIRASWTREENLHLTLKFLGDVPVADIPKLSAAVEAAAQTVRPFRLTVSGCGAFPPHGQPKVLWIGVLSEPPAVAGDSTASSEAASLESLHKRMEDDLATAGFPREERPFHPHLTIARLRTPKSGRELSDFHQALGFAPQSFSVSEVVVFKSDLLREGSKHTPISRHPLHE